MEYYSAFRQNESAFQYPFFYIPALHLPAILPLQQVPNVRFYEDDKSFRKSELSKSGFLGGKKVIHYQ